MIILYFLLMMIPIIVIHELGHLYAGRAFGIRAETFSVGFGPELFARRDAKGTIWRVAALPLGGYVRFAADQNGTNFPAVARDKPPYLAPFYGKLATIFAGPFANFLLSFLLLFALASIHGLPSDEPVIDKVNIASPLEGGDRIISAGGTPINRMSEFYELAGSEGARIAIEVEREESVLALEIENPHRARVNAVIPGEAADGAGIEIDDVITQYGGKPIIQSRDLIEAIAEYGGTPAPISILRGGEAMEFEILPRQKSDGVFRIGLIFSSPYESAPEKLGMGEAGLFGLEATFWVLDMSIQGIRDLFIGDISPRALSGPVGIAEMAEEAAISGFWRFIQFTAIVSSSIGFLNLLPIPVLDGGHIVLLSYERLMGRLPSQIVINSLFALGIALLLGLLLFTTTNEIIS